MVRTTTVEKIPSSVIYSNNACIATFQKLFKQIYSGLLIDYAAID